MGEFMEFSTDYVMVKDKDIFGLWNKYIALCMTYYKKLPAIIKKDVYEYGFEEFRQDCYIVFYNAVEAIKIEKIKNPKTYTCYIQLSQYLHNFTKRNIVRDYCNNYCIHYMDYEGGTNNKEYESTWDSILAKDYRTSNLKYLLDLLSDKDRDIALKIMYRMPRGGKGLSEEGKSIIRTYYSLFQ
jgi:hypothetical protein